MTDSASTVPASPPPATGSTEASRVSRRVPFWDNARFACIVLVVLGHAVQRLTYDSDIALGLYLMVYAFHMPAFAIIAGYFSKSDPPTRRQMARVITDIIVPYVIFEGLWTLTKWIVEGQATPDLTTPSWTLWFLLALGIFRLILPYLALLRWPLLWTLVISIGAGYLPNIDSTLSLSRTLGLLPFFTLGWWLRERDIVARLRLLDRRPWWVIGAAIGVFALAGWAAWFFVDGWREMNLREWLFYERELRRDRRYAVVGRWSADSPSWRWRSCSVPRSSRCSRAARIGGPTSASTRCTSTCCIPSCCTRSASRASCATSIRPGSGCRSWS